MNTPAERTAVRLRQVNAAFTLLLVAVTWRLWTPQEVYPRVPFFGALVNAAEGIELAAGGVWILGLLAALLPTRLRYATSIGLAAAVAGGTSLILFDQHRLQPWAYLSLLVCIAILLLPAGRSVKWLRWLIISVYVHSAISKLDHSFLHSHGPELCNAAVSFLGLSLKRLNESSRVLVALSLPLAELLIALGLWSRGFRRAAVWGSVAMHILLLIALGPLGLNHKPAVLLWNTQFIAQNLLLFRDAADVDATESNERSSFVRSTGAFAGVATLLAAIALPLLEPFGYFDHWPAWALYVSRPERVTVSVHVLSRDRLPEAVRDHADPPRQLWCEVHLDRWSLDALDAPIYPQARYRLAVALALAKNAKLGDALRVVIESPANRLTGQRQRREVHGVDGMRKELRRFTLNTANR